MKEFRAAVEAYLKEVAETQPLGVAEMAYYPALKELFNSIGGQLNPPVQTVAHAKAEGALQPDMEFFAGQSKTSSGVVEVKGADAELAQIANSKQVVDYWNQHGLVLVTNLRQFALVGQDQSGQRAVLERYSLAATAEEFAELIKRPRKAANEHGVLLGEYLSRVMEHRATISEPRDLARLLASYARDALERVNAAGDHQSLKQIRDAMEDGLGMKFEGDAGDKFFRSSLVQTLFYGIFAAWVLWAQAGGGKEFRWRESVDYLRTPVLRSLFFQITDPGKLTPLDLPEVMNWTQAALERVESRSISEAIPRGRSSDVLL